MIDKLIALSPASHNDHLRTEKGIVKCIKKTRKEKKRQERKKKLGGGSAWDVVILPKPKFCLVRRVRGGGGRRRGWGGIVPMIKRCSLWRLVLPHKFRR